ncbi:methyltransferase domain-containing protein [Iamia majanohamensis]|uniref:Methyltransferase domain-containing protein n=1 Tax=Iamia majanohamensis TaxID=467976 RepID=A0AAF0BSD1_9ACTN|nr:methyltransferase domain-containing protein [Iamia majanohamensis]WCO68106.1 methyltransferase domain-containing protein [Iamia majanohamensis]
MSDDVTGPTEAEEHWEARYRDSDRVWSGRVTAVLQAEAARLTPGTAVDLGCGEGADAIWLARQGWDVTAVDISATALARVEEHAAEAGVADRVRTARHELGRSFPEGTWDLVSAQFLQSQVELDRVAVLRRGAEAVAPGGVLLSVSHAAPPAWAPEHMADHHFPQPDEEREALALDPGAWEVLRCEVVAREGRSPDGHTGTLLDGVLLLRRR